MQHDACQPYPAGGRRADAARRAGMPALCGARDGTMRACGRITTVLLRCVTVTKWRLEPRSGEDAALQQNTLLSARTSSSRSAGPFDGLRGTPQSGLRRKTRPCRSTLTRRRSKKSDETGLIQQVKRTRMTCRASDDGGTPRDGWVGDTRAPLFFTGGWVGFFFLA